MPGFQTVSWIDHIVMCIHNWCGNSDRMIHGCLCVCVCVCVCVQTEACRQPLPSPVAEPLPAATLESGEEVPAVPAIPLAVIVAAAAAVAAALLRAIVTQMMMTWILGSTSFRLQVPSHPLLCQRHPPSLQLQNQLSLSAI